MATQWEIKQPWLGIAGTAVCITAALVISSLFDVATFSSWVTLLLVSAVPAQIIFSMIWENRLPVLTGRLMQPGKGLVLTLGSLVSGLLVTFTTLIAIGGGITPPTPYVIMFSILSVVICIWLIVIMRCWPISELPLNPLCQGICVWLTSYVLAYLLFNLFFNFTFLRNTPLHFDHLDPHGWFNAWSALSFAVTTLLVIDILLLLEFWPIPQLAQRFPFLDQQPAQGTITSGTVLLIAAAFWHFCVTYLEMHVIVLLVRVAVSTIFGAFIMLLMMQTAPVQAVKQPLKGVILLLFSIVLAILMYQLYVRASVHLVGALSNDKPHYQLDLWVASAMLAVTFPVLVIFAEFFEFWPLLKKRKADNI